MRCAAAREREETFQCISYGWQVVAVGAGCLSNDHGAVGDGALGVPCDCDCVGTGLVGTIVSDPVPLLLSVAESLELGTVSVTDESVAVSVSVAVDEAGSPEEGEAEAAVEMGTIDKGRLGGAMVSLLLVLVLLVVLGEIGPGPNAAVVVTRRPGRGSSRGDKAMAIRCCDSIELNGASDAGR